MQKVTILSPVHIGNGLNYPNYLLVNGKKYRFEDMVRATFHRNSKVLLSPDFLDKIASTKASAAGSAKQEIAKVIVPNAEEIKTIEPEYEVTISAPKVNQWDINEHMKTMNQMFIPGSTIKGYIINVLMFDVIKNNQQIRNFFQRNLNNKNLIKNVELEVQTLANQQFICRDIMFEHKPEIKLISRISKKGPIPILFECLPINATSQNDFIVWNKIDLNLEKQGFKNDISLPFYNEMVKRIRNFYSLFGKMNKDFLLNAISYEKVFIKDCPYSMNFDKKSAITQLELIEKELHKGKIIVQIGKNINYIAKTTGHAYDRTFYVNNFYQFFNPGMDPKIKGAKVATPNKINSMNLVSNSMSEMYEMVPGFMEIEW